MEENYRGKCESKTKVTKDGRPKRAGNFSYSVFHAQSMQSKDYHVKKVINEYGNEILIVGDHTPLWELMGGLVEELALRDKTFDTYTQQGYKTIGSKKYEAHKTLKKSRISMRYGYELDFIYREQIYTDKDFEYQFIEY